MKTGAILGVVLFVLLTATKAFADGPSCLVDPNERGPAKHDTTMGANCVRHYQVEETEFTAFRGVVLAAWVYRMVNGRPVTVWRGLGRVVEATPQKLRVRVSYTPKANDFEDYVTYEYDLFWNGKAYATR